MSITQTIFMAIVSSGVLSGLRLAVTLMARESESPKRSADVPLPHSESSTNQHRHFAPAVAN